MSIQHHQETTMHNVSKDQCQQLEDGSGGGEREGGGTALFSYFRVILLEIYNSQIFTFFPISVLQDIAIRGV